MLKKTTLLVLYISTPFVILSKTVIHRWQVVEVHPRKNFVIQGGRPMTMLPPSEACIQFGRLGQGRCRVQMVEHVGHMLGRRWWCGGVRIETGGNTGTPEPTN